MICHLRRSAARVLVRAVRGLQVRVRVRVRERGRSGEGARERGWGRMIWLEGWSQLLCPMCGAVRPFLHAETAGSIRC
eukprot:6190066-Pleurochrysis_carterae.AAC.3